MLYIPQSHFTTIEGNTIVHSGDTDTSNPIINFQSESVGSVIKGNVIEVISEKHTGYAIQSLEGSIVEGNRLSLKSGKGIYISSNSNCTNNIIICATAEQQALFANGGIVNTVVANNISNGVFQINSTNVTKENNITCAALEFATA